MTVESPLLVADGLTKVFGTASRIVRAKGAGVRALTDVSLEVAAGETVGIVGETGCGKSTLGRVIARLITATAGRAWLDGEETFGLAGEALHRFRRSVQLVFQDPFVALNPRAKIGTTLQEPLDVHRIGRREERAGVVSDLLERVGLRPSHAEGFPHELSGGMRQRVVIARALATDPRLVICDEPVSALDVSVQSQVLNLLLDLQQERGLSYLFITHDLTVARLMSDSIAVMYLGRIVENAPATEIFASPLHPYTRALISAIPTHSRSGQEARERIILRGEIPSPSSPPPGCAFQTRCPEVMEICRSVVPPLARVSERRFVACHLHHPDPREHELPIFRITPPATVAPALADVSPPRDGTALGG